MHVGVETTSEGVVVVVGFAVFIGVDVVVVVVVIVYVVVVVVIVVVIVVVVVVVVVVCFVVVALLAPAALGTLRSSAAATQPVAAPLGDLQIMVISMAQATT